MEAEDTPAGGALASADELRVQAKIGQLIACAGHYELLQAEQAAKRLAWWEEHRARLALTGPLPRQAYTLFLLEYLRLDPAEAPVIYEDERKIVWRSYNFCPLLEACSRLGLDTRVVCRRGSEESVQALIACLDARLRFSRNYASGLRPYAAYCEESIALLPHAGENASPAGSTNPWAAPAAGETVPT